MRHRLLTILSALSLLLCVADVALWARSYAHQDVASWARAVDRPWHGRTLFADRKSTRLNSSHLVISYAVFCLKKNIRPERALLALAADPDGQTRLHGLGISARVVELEVLALQVREDRIEEHPQDLLPSLHMLL